MRRSKRLKLAFIREEKQGETKMGLGGFSNGFFLLFLLIGAAFVALVFAALIKYVFGLGKRTPS